jgi:hypothetical protein
MQLMTTAWPDLTYSEWSDTCETLHMWTQIVGKVRMLLTPPINHWWHTTLYVNSRGLGTSPIPKNGGTFDIDFDFIDHRLVVSTTNGERRQFDLRPMSVADFYARFMALLAELHITAKINTLPSEVANPIPFEKDTQHASYDKDAVSRFWRVLVAACRVMTAFRAEFIGKVSPVHLFWGGLDLAVTRFSARKAPEHPPVPGIPDSITREAYSHEVSSAGFWPGGNGAEAAFYSYGYPEPPGLSGAKVLPAAAFYSTEMREFLLPYESVRRSASPADDVMAFLRSTYEAEATLANWPRQELERRTGG